MMGYEDEMRSACWAMLRNEDARSATERMMR